LGDVYNISESRWVCESNWWTITACFYFEMKHSDPLFFLFHF
jgi:hypothetical protein